MARTTSALVGGIAEVDSSIDLDPFIDIANQLVTELCTDSGYDTDRLTSIETWLSAHFYHLRDQVVDTEKAGSVSAKYQYKIGMHFNQTKYGQTAMLLDTAGNLAKLNAQIEDGKSGTISFNWMGEDYDSEDSD